MHGIGGTRHATIEREIRKVVTDGLESCISTAIIETRTDYQTMLIEWQRSHSHSHGRGETAFKGNLTALFFLFIGTSFMRVLELPSITAHNFSRPFFYLTSV
jgi:hypothetical protein